MHPLWEIQPLGRDISARVHLSILHRAGVATTMTKIYLCCGAGTGVSGDDWIGFDIEDHGFRPLVLQDIRTLDGRRFRDSEFIFATPPCSGFTDLPWRPATGEYLDVLLACLRICQESGVPWLIENSRFARKHIGPETFHRGSHYFWGRGPGIVPLFNHVKGRVSGRSPLERAALPTIMWAEDE